MKTTNTVVEKQSCKHQPYKQDNNIIIPISVLVNKKRKISSVAKILVDA